MKKIPLMSVPSQRLTVTLSGQLVSLVITQRTTGLFIDMYLSGVALALGVVCIDRAPITALGFDGALAFVDKSGNGNNPSYSLLNDSVFLYYLTSDELR